MGWRFELKHTNTVAYLTVPDQHEPPRSTASHLAAFLGSIQGQYRDRPPLWSDDEQWVEDIAKIARDASRVLESLVVADPNQPMDTASIKLVLHDLKVAFHKPYSVYGLAIGNCRDQNLLRSFGEHAAYSSRHHGLFLIPDLPRPEETLEMFNPVPMARIVATRPGLWPGIVLWTPSGTSAFVPIEQATGLLQEILDSLQGNRQDIVRILSSFTEKNRSQETKRLLHLSDLHFGNNVARENQAYLSLHLGTVLPSISRVVVTGDLFDSPRKKDALDFRNFRADLEAKTGKELIVIPGNHDQKVFGNTFLGYGQKLKELCRLQWSNLVVDDNLQCVFLCFDSSRDALNFARGKVTGEQMMEIATRFETIAISKPQLRDYLQIALVHHHPYSFQTEPNTFLQYSQEFFGLREENFLRMDEADQFLRWCAGRPVPLILHGHKHVQRYVTNRIMLEPGKSREYREVTVVGCGTSLGVGRKPLSYNILEWIPSARKWSISLFSDSGPGAGFKETPDPNPGTQFEETFVALHNSNV